MQTAAAFEIPLFQAAQSQVAPIIYSKQPHLSQSLPEITANMLLLESGLRPNKRVYQVNSANYSKDEYKLY